MNLKPTFRPNNIQLEFLPFIAIVNKKKFVTRFSIDIYLWLKIRAVWGEMFNLKLEVIPNLSLFFFKLEIFNNSFYDF